MPGKASILLIVWDRAQLSDNAMTNQAKDASSGLISASFWAADARFLRSGHVRAAAKLGLLAHLRDRLVVPWKSTSPTTALAPMRLRFH
jgi:hypothetical protein